MFDANLSQSNTHNYTCLMARVKATVGVCYRATNMLNKAKINLPSRESQIHFPRSQSEPHCRTPVKKKKKKKNCDQKTELNLYSIGY